MAEAAALNFRILHGKLSSEVIKVLNNFTAHLSILWFKATLFSSNKVENIDLF